MEDLDSLVQDNITMEKLTLNVRFHHGTFEKFHQMILSQLIMSSVFKCYLILLLRHELVFTTIQNLHYIIYSSYCFGFET